MASSRVRGASSGWLPTDISGLICWLDADDASTFTLNDDSEVLEWRDKSGQGNHATNIGGSTATRTGTMNGRASVALSSVADALQIPGLTSVVLPYSVFAVCRITNSGNRSIFGGGTGAMQLRRGSGNLQYLRRGQASIGSGGSISTDTDLMVGVSHAAGGAWNLYVNGTSTGSGSSVQTFATGTAHQIGSAYGERMEGQVSEVIVTDGVPSAAEIASWTSYCQSKWGIA